MNKNGTDKPNRARRSHWGTGIFIAVILFVFATLGVVFFAISLDYHLVAEDYYESAVNYQEQIDRIQETHRHRQHPEVELVRDHSSLRLQFPRNDSGHPDGEIIFYRPSDSTLDLSLPLSVDSRGVQELSLADMASGKWIVHIYWTSNGIEFYQQKSIYL